MEKHDFLRLMQRYVANIAIGPSTLRNQGADDVPKHSRTFLADLDLTVFGRIEPGQYSDVLDRWTNELQRRLPVGAQNWGTARKALNVFLTQTYLNRYLSEEHGLSDFGDVLETPLDSQAARMLRKLAGRGKLPRWEGIKRLRPENSRRYQEFAAEYAKEEGIQRACLDIRLWRAER